MIKRSLSYEVYLSFKGMSIPKAIVTGGAGFIGSHLVDRLMKEEWEVVVIDNLSSGNLDNINKWLNNSHFKFIKLDLKDKNKVIRKIKEADVVFHLAANPEVRVGVQDPITVYEDNVEATLNVLEAMRINRIPLLVFTSSSTVYGEARIKPTPEEYTPLEPISIYGACKLACEAIISGYAHTFGFRALILRLANIIGPRSRHGVIYDFIRKLRKDQSKLEILGDGTQKKSYLYIDDCIDAILHLLNIFMRSSHTIDIYNIGSPDWITVKEIADIVVKEMKLKDIRYVFTGGVNGGRGWKGDVKYMLLDINKACATGWKPRYGSRDAVRLAVKALIREVR